MDLSTLEWFEVQLPCDGHDPWDLDRVLVDVSDGNDPVCDGREWQDLQRKLADWSDGEPRDAPEPLEVLEMDFPLLDFWDGGPEDCGCGFDLFESDRLLLN